MLSVEHPQIQRDVLLSPFTTLGLGGSARWYISATTVDDVMYARQWALDHDKPLVVLGGGSNVVVSDSGVDGLVMRINIKGCKTTTNKNQLELEVSAGEDWDPIVEQVVQTGFGGLECLSGIPGSVGGTPIQNVGAYGQEVSDSIQRVRAIDSTENRVVEIEKQDCGFGYRSSRFRTIDVGRFILTHVIFRLRTKKAKAVYPDVVKWLNDKGVQDPSVADVRHAVLAIRRTKGMVLDSSDSDTRSIGSFFVNPVIDNEMYSRMTRNFEGFLPGFKLSKEEVKIPAAWLIEQAGFLKGHRNGEVGLSTKHPLAIVNRGKATAREIIDLAVLIKRRVADRFGIFLKPEARFVGFETDDAIKFLYKEND